MSEKENFQPEEHALARPTRHRDPSGQHSAQDRLRAWVEANYTHVPLREKDTGTKLDVLYSAYTGYTAANPPVHQKPLGEDQVRAAAERGLCGHRAAPQRGWHCERALPAALARGLTNLAKLMYIVLSV